MCAWCLRKPEERESDPLELQMAVGHHVGAGDQTQAFYKKKECSKPLKPFPEEGCLCACMHTSR